MKNLLLLFFVSVNFVSKAQTTIATSYITNTVVFSTGLTYITFAIRNNNVYPVTLTNLEALQANLYENNVYSLWYSSTSLSGAPSVTSPGWTLVSTSLHPFTSSTIGLVTPFDCIGLVIPPATTYRFAFQGTKGTSVRTAVTPNIFSAGGVDLLVGDNTSTGGQIGYFGWQNLGNAGAAYFFDGSITFAQAGTYTDIEVLNITKPSSVCSSTSSSLLAQICNKSPHMINFSTVNTTVNFNVTGPGSPQNASFTMAGSLAPCGCINAAVGGINFSASGNYMITANAIVTGTTDIDLSNNTFVDSLTNYKPIVTPLTDSVCQFTSGPVFSGFSGSNCQPRKRSITVNALLASPLPIDGSSDANAGLFAQASLPGLPAGAVITGGRLFITNLNASTTGSFGSEARFNIYSVSPALPILPGQAGNPLNFSIYNFDYVSELSVSQLNALYSVIGAGNIFKVGYWESLDNLFGGSDITLNAQSLPTQVTLTIEYTINPNVRWYNSAAGGSSFYTGSVMNPFVTASGLFNTNTIGNYTFYVACSADSACRVPVQLKIKPSPAVVQDSLSSCEVISSSGTGLFNLSSISNVVSAFNPAATVSYYQDYNLSLLISNPANYVTYTNYIYSKVEQGGCYSSDTVYLLVHPKPSFGAGLVSGNACIPDYIDAASLIDPFSFVTPGTDTIYYDDATYTTLHPSPHMITSVDTVYMVFETNTNPSCSDTSIAEINVMQPNTHIVNQDTNFNFSIWGSVGCANIILSDGNIDTLHSTIDCSRVAYIGDLPNGISLGSTTICEEIEASVPFHFGQPYVNRHYQITPTINDSAMICLYFLDDDLVQYNNAAFGSWPLLPTAADTTLVTNLCFAQVRNGDINTPGHTVVSIPNTAISHSYDSASTVWTFCFVVDSFSHFYLHAQNPLNIPLPVNILSFTGRKNNASTLLEWTTSEENNMHYFTVERSNSSKNFKAISSPIESKAFQGNNYGILNYSFEDIHPMSGHNYYRLQQTDLNGSSQASKIVDVYFDNGTSVIIYPNPIHDELNVEIFAVSNSLCHIKISDATGKTVKVIDSELREGKNEIISDISSLSEGMYLVSITNDQGLHYTETIMKR